MTNVTQETVEIPEPVVVNAPEVPTRDDVKSRGWSKAEMDSAEKLGLITKSKKEEEKVEPKPDETKPDLLEEKKAEPTKGEEQKVPEKKFQRLPDLSLTEEQEKALSGILPPGNPLRGMYFRMKNERTARQNLEAQLAKEREEKAALELRVKRASPGTEPEENDEDPDDKPLTVRALRELREQEASEYAKKQAEINARASAVTDAQRSQEEFAREIYTDFDEVVTRASEVIKNIDSIAEPWKRSKAVKLFRDLQQAAANADTLGLDDYNAAMIAYEIGQLHPLHGQKAEQNGNAPKPEPKANGGLTPDQMKRIEENTQRRASSASVPGGSGKRFVSADEVSLADLNKMTTEQRLSFREKHRDRYDKLLRG